MIARVGQVLGYAVQGFLLFFVVAVFLSLIGEAVATVSSY